MHNAENRAITIIQISFKEKGSGLFGAFCGYAIILAITVWLLYRTNRTKNEGNVEEKLASLRNLKNSGLLSDEEYDSKRESLNIEHQQIRASKSQEYLKAKSLLESGVLTESEFIRITNTILENLTKNENLKPNSETKTEADPRTVIVLGIIAILFIIYIFFKVGLGWR